MFNSAFLKQIILEQKGIFLNTEEIIEREILQRRDFWDICNLPNAVIVTGVRRCGKSYLMKLIWREIRQKEKAPDDNFLYVNFESEKMIDFTAKDFDVLLEAYFEAFSPVKNKKIYLFFDEIQNISGWEKFINRLLSESKFKIFITGSNASLLSKEIGTALTGRNYPLRLYPLSFKEFCAYRLGRQPAQQDLGSASARANTRKIWNDYVNIGGFPEVVKTNFRPLLEEYLRNIIYRDIVLRHRIKYEASLREIVMFLTSNAGLSLSLDKISKMTRVKNIMTVKNYLSYLEDSFLFYFIPKHSYSVKQQIYNPDKIYLCDSGMQAELNLSPGKNHGWALENIAAGEFIRQGFNVSYFSGKRECDFVLSQKNKPVAAVQASLELSDNRSREVEGLLEAMRECKLKRGLILTENEEGQIKTDGKIINVMPLYKLALTRNKVFLLKDNL